MKTLLHFLYSRPTIRGPTLRPLPSLVVRVLSTSCRPCTHLRRIWACSRKCWPKLVSIWQARQYMTTALTLSSTNCSKHCRLSSLRLPWTRQKSPKSRTTKWWLNTANLRSSNSSDKPLNVLRTPMSSMPTCFRNGDKPFNVNEKSGSHETQRTNTSRSTKSTRKRGGWTKSYSATIASFRPRNSVT